MPLIHLTVRCRYPLKPLNDRDVCADLWRRLQRRFPQVLACVFMPNHLHLDLECSDPNKARKELALELMGLTQSRFPHQRIWDPVPPPQVLSDLLHLQRHIRYVHLNPCRGGLARDPVEWEWSTHRDAVGATGVSWLDHRLLHRIFKSTPRNFSRIFHEYVSGDPTVQVQGTPAPHLPDLHRLVAGLEQIEGAVLQATRSSRAAMRTKGHVSRRIAAHLALQLGGGYRVRCAEWLGVSDRGLRKILDRAPTQSEARAIQAASLVLAHPQRFAAPSALNRAQGEGAISPTFRYPELGGGPLGAGGA